MALDREAMIEGIVYGYGSVANSTVPPFFWQADPQGHIPRRPGSLRR